MKALAVRQELKLLPIKEAELSFEEGNQARICYACGTVYYTKYNKSCPICK